MPGAAPFFHIGGSQRLTLGMYWREDGKRDLRRFLLTATGRLSHACPAPQTSRRASPSAATLSSSFPRAPNPLVRVPRPRRRHRHVEIERLIRDGGKALGSCYTRVTSVKGANRWRRDW